MIQLQQNKLAATSLLLTNIQMNHLLSNEEAECGINPNSEDLDLEEDDGCSTKSISGNVSKRKREIVLTQAKTALRDMNECLESGW